MGIRSCVVLLNILCSISSFLSVFYFLKCCRYKFVVSATEPKKVGSPPLTNIQVFVRPSFCRNTMGLILLGDGCANSFRLTIALNFLDIILIFIEYMNISTIFFEFKLNLFQIDGYVSIGTCF